MTLRFVAAAAVLCTLVLTPAGADAQLRGMLKKKAGDLLKGKAADPEPASGGAAASPTTTPAEPATPTATTPTPTATTPAATAAAPAANRNPPRADAKPAASPLDPGELRLEQRAAQIFRELRANKKGDWDELPYIPSRAVEAARALDDTAQVALVEKLGAAFKAIVMSEAFATAHAAYIKQNHKAVDHGLKGVVSMEQMQARGDYQAMAAAAQRQVPLQIVTMANGMSAEDIQRTLSYEVPGWKKSGEDPKRSDAAKYRRWATQGDALIALGTTDVEKLRRGFAVLKSEDLDGPKTEEALYAAYEKVKAESEQAAWDEHNLRTVVKRTLTAFIALAQTVDYNAATVQKSGRTRFTTAANEARGAVWKACFRAGKGPSTAAVQIAQGWLKELS